MPGKKKGATLNSQSRTTKKKVAASNDKETKAERKTIAKKSTKKSNPTGNRTGTDNPAYKKRVAAKRAARDKANKAKGRPTRYAHKKS